MAKSVISVENLSKYYRLGVIGSGTLREDIDRWWSRVRGRGDPLLESLAVGPNSRKGGQIWALSDVSFQVEEGEVLGVIGRNGAGKSTLLKVLSRITAPTSGRALIRGRVGSLLEVGTGFHPELTGRENIYLNGAILGMRRAEVTRKLDEIVEFAEVAKFADTPVKRYSSGMLVRLAFAVAAHLEPEILIVDEVLAVGDAAFQRKCLGKMKHVSTQGRTVLFVSHNMQTVESLCAVSLVFDKGKIVFSGSTVDAIQHYLGLALPDRSSNGKYDLSNRNDRQGEGSVRIRSLSLLDRAHGAPVAQVRTGDSLCIKVEVDIKLPPARYALGIGFFSASGHYLCGIRSDSVRDNFYSADDFDVCYCYIDKLPLAPGEYTFNVIAGGVRSTLDWVQQAGTLEVAQGDFYGTGKLPAERRQGVLIDYSWSQQA